MGTKKIVIFASGGGSNAQSIIDYFDGNERVEVSYIFTHNPNAGVIGRAIRHHIPYMVFNRESFHNGDVLNQLNNLQPDLIILAGFLWLMPPEIVTSFLGKIINIHPALLPKFGGHGMYGMNVHKAVKEAGETTSGITIHYVNEKYDEGGIIFQETCIVAPQHTAQDIAANVLKLEHLHYPKIIDKLLFASH